MSVLLFGDQTGLSYDFLKDSIQKTRNSALVVAFLDNVASALRHEVAGFSKPDQEGIPSFTTVQELVERQALASPGHPAIEAALFSISQFIHFIGYISLDFSISTT